MSVNYVSVATGLVMSIDIDHVTVSEYGEVEIELANGHKHTLDYSTDLLVNVPE